ncbi:bifunctional 2-polyprenyl-6-hydroxyphenol methylase/3-demethylubiquinol 3-O-methyltransferase UbiG [Polynucleobacter sp. UB-Tiil-W10]|uniref:class I SAM-dependent methyltransferase n=1 Tax=Polynucleobacter sp. UB-Tiil-W10 TaxID=1855648 RepID=UPI001C0B9943|nr:class I SAM-dependent methyltransferase [Polynucleobacter sp. UB-Tiil-W10]MBU3540823.1 class I SAM-dependent methyltransferase [Polynucleobacter sp. UB-Tiil-W10]
MTARTVEAQYDGHVELKLNQGLTKLGIEKNANWHTDPRRLVFALSRYKFVSKMLSGKNRVLEVGCGDAFPMRILLQEVKSVHGIDIDPIFIEDALARMDPKWPFTCAVHDITSGHLQEKFDAAFSLDVLEHIPKEQDDVYFTNIAASLTNSGVLIVGMPSLESQAYASPLSKIGHVNCKTGAELKTLAERHFQNVFIFSMNDEVVHTGYQPMSQYLFALCVGKLSTS